MKYPKIRSYLLVTRYNDKVSIGSSINKAVEINDPSGEIYQILLKMDGNHTPEEIYNKLHKKYKNITMKNIENLILGLKDNNYILEDQSDYIEYFKDDKKERHKRNINFLGNFSALGNEKYEYIRRIQEQRIILLGLGGVGSTVLFNLSALGVENIMGIDFDRVDRTNLNRQILYRESDIGDLKVLSAKRTVEEFNSDVNFEHLNKKIENEDDLRIIVENYCPTFIICAADRPSVLLNEWINTICLEKNIPWIYGGNSESVSYYRLIKPHITSCYMCNESNFNNNDQYEAIEKIKYIKDFQPSPENNCIASSSSILGSMMVFDFIKYVTNMAPTKSESSIIKIDYATMEITDNFIKKNNSCMCRL